MCGVRRLMLEVERLASAERAVSERCSRPGARAGADASDEATGTGIDASRRESMAVVVTMAGCTRASKPWTVGDTMRAIIGQGSGTSRLRRDQWVSVSRIDL